MSADRMMRVAAPSRWNTRGAFVVEGKGRDSTVAVVAVVILSGWWAA